MHSRLFADKLIGYTEINLTSLPSNCESSYCCIFVRLAVTCNLHSPKQPERCCGLLFAKISIFEANLGQISPSCWKAPQRSFTFPLEYTPSVPTVHSTKPSYVMPCCCYCNGRPTVATAAPPPANPQFAYQYCGGPNQPVIQRRVSTDAFNRNVHVSRAPSMTPEMFPVIPNPALS